MNQYIKYELKHLWQRLQGNKFSSNANKTEIIIIKHKIAEITKTANFRVS